MREYRAALHYNGPISIQRLSDWRGTFPPNLVRDGVIASITLSDGAVVTEDDIDAALGSLAHDDSVEDIYFRDLCPREPWTMAVTWVKGPPGWAEAEVTAPTPRDLAKWVQRLEQFGMSHNVASSSGSEAALSADSRQAVEAVITCWQRSASDLGLDPESLGIGDTLASTTAELLRHEKPPRGVLTSMLRWFGEKADVFATKAAESAGEAVGPAFKAGALLAAGKVTGLWSELNELVSAALRRLEE